MVKLCWSEDFLKDAVSFGRICRDAGDAAGFLVSSGKPWERRYAAALPEGLDELEKTVSRLQDASPLGVRLLNAAERSETGGGEPETWVTVFLIAGKLTALWRSAAKILIPALALLKPSKKADRQEDDFGSDELDRRWKAWRDSARPDQQGSCPDGIAGVFERFLHCRDAVERLEKEIRRMDAELS